MEGVDRNFVLVSLAIDVAPWALVYALGFLPIAPVDVRRWFAPFGRLGDADLPTVTAHLERSRRTRRLGLLLGGCAGFALSLYAAPIHRNDLDGVLNPLSLLLLGYCSGAVLAEVRAARSPSGTRRAADLRPRRLSAYVAPWVIPTVVGLWVLSAVLVPAPATWSSWPERLAVSVTAGVLVLAAVLAARWVITRPQPVAGNERFLDDAFRHAAVSSCLVSALAVVTITVLDAVSGLVVGQGGAMAWILLPLAVVPYRVLWLVPHPSRRILGARVRPAAPAPT